MLSVLLCRPQARPATVNLTHKNSGDHSHPRALEVLLRTLESLLIEAELRGEA